MIDWLKRRHAKKLWLSMLKFYEKYDEELEGHKGAHFVLAMDYMKKIAENKH